MSRSRLDPEPTLEGLPGWVPPTLFAVVTVALFREFIFSDLMLVGQDTFSLGYAARAFLANALRTTGFPLWNPQILGGTPFLESLAGGDSLYPPSLLLLFLADTYRALGWKLVLHVFLAGCFMYVWIRSLGGSKGAALLSGLVYLLAPYLVSLVFPGHDGKLFVTALTPLLFWAVERVFSHGGLTSAASVGTIVTLVILTTHFQMAYFLFGAVGVYAVFRAVQVAKGADGWIRGGRRFALFLSASLLGAGTAGVQLVPAVDYVTEYSRRTMTTTASEGEDGVAYSSSWSLHPEEAVALVVPEFVGNSAGGAAWATGTYWGRNPFKTNHEYLGLMALLLAMISFMGGAHAGIRWCLVAIGSTALLFSLGAHTPVWRIAYALLPGISLFRAPSMAVFLTGFAVATLAGIGTDRGLRLVSEGKGGQVARALLVPLGILVGGWLLAEAGGLTSLWLTVFSPDLTETTARALEAAQPHMTRGFLVASVLAAATYGVWWAIHRAIVSVAWGVGLLALLICADEARVDLPFIQTTEFEGFAGPDGNMEFLIDRAAESEPFRVLSMFGFGQDVRPAIHGLELAAGHHPNDLARYRELIGMVGSGLPEYLAPPFHPNVTRMLNVQYVLWPDVEFGPLDPFVSEGTVELVSRLEYSDGSAYSSVYSYPGLPRARVVGEVLVVPEEQVVETILDESVYDPAVQVVLTEPLPVELGGSDVEGSVTWVERTPNRLVLDVEATGSAVLVLSENWYPAWRASVDGAEAPVLRADHTLRAVAVPGGEHRVELWYQSDLLRNSLILSMACTLVLASLALGGLVVDGQWGRGPNASVGG